MPIKIQYQEHLLADVMDYFGHGFDVTGQSAVEGKIVNAEWLLDPVKRVVVFKLYIEEKTKKRKLKH